MNNDLFFSSKTDDWAKKPGTMVTSGAFKLSKVTIIENEKSNIMIKDTHAKEIDDWCYDSARKEGDVEVVVTPTGAYVLYYIGEYDQTYREYTSDREMRAEDFDVWEEESLKAYTGKEGAFMGFGNKGL